MAVSSHRAVVGDSLQPRLPGEWSEGGAMERQPSPDVFDSSVVAELRGLIACTERRHMFRSDVNN